MKLRQTNYRIEGLATFQVDSQIIPSISGVLFLCWLPASFSCFARRQIIQYYTYYIFIYIHTYTLWHLFCYAAFCLSLSTCICLSIKVFSQLTHTHTHFTTYFTCRYKDSCQYISCFTNTRHISEPISRCHTMLPLPGYLLYIGDYTTQLYWN